MDTLDFKPNSHKSKEPPSEEPKPEKKVERITKGEVVVKKKNPIANFFRSFIAEDAANLKTYIIYDVILPNVKKAIDDTVTNGVHMALYGEADKSHKKGSTVSYSKYYDDDSRKGRVVESGNRGYKFDDAVIPTRGEAEEVLDKLDDLIDTYGEASVADFYDLVGIKGDYTDNKYGWRKLRSATIVRTRNGYIINLPKAIPLD